VTHTAALFQLQTLDSQLDTIVTRLDEIARLLGDNEAVRQAQQTLDAAQAAHLKWKTRATDLELERASLKQEVDAAEQRLYSGRMHNPRELTDLQDKVASLRHRLETLEDPLLEVMLEIEQAEADIAASRAALDRILAEQAAALGHLTAEQRDLQTRRDALQSQVAAARAGIHPDHLALYDKLRKRQGGVAVAPLKRDICGVCGVQITSREMQVVQHGEVLPCPTCGRILVTR
jgi:hypothetical protein